ncbi:lytic transglycosylase domain-containing protein [Streptomyces sp. SPB78]|uniref:lytic transglycosylase domain-containing protein n=1 Tax=Streptomyces sp. (strain SPB78) TaxID=591157 RepID=UPI0001B584EA|nr:lytic murein transglycosylase [Streptomyces sp. SPB78]
MDVHEGKTPMRPLRIPRPRGRRLRGGLRGTAVAVAATALLNASQAPALVEGLTKHHKDAPGPVAAPLPPLPEVPTQGDDSYHVESPPVDPLKAPGARPPVVEVPLRRSSGLPATVLAAYQRAESSLAHSRPGCHLPWQLLAAIGQVESGQARGGDVDAHGTTRHRITGPALDGDGFALIRDTENGAWDGDPVYDRAVGPLQFLPGTWRRWGADGNGDGRADPNNIYDAALGAGRYLCAGGRDLATGGGLERAVLSYNYSRDYLQLVLRWLAFYRDGAHAVPDGTGVVPKSPGAGGDREATAPVGDGGKGNKGGGIVIGPRPGEEPEGKPSPGPGTTAPPTGPSPDPSSGGSPDPSPSPSDPGSSPTGSTPPSEPPSGTPDPSASEDPGTPSPSACPSDSTTAPPPADEATPTETPEPTESPCATSSP